MQAHYGIYRRPKLLVTLRPAGGLPMRVERRAPQDATAEAVR